MQISGSSSITALYKAMLEPRSKTDKTEATQDTTATNAPSAASEGISSMDFGHMSRNQMQTVAKQMYESCAIDADQMWSLTLMGPMGKAGPNGEFQPFSASERAAADNQPMDYNKMISDALAGSKASASDTSSSYQNLLALQSALQEWQGRPFSVDITA